MWLARGKRRVFGWQARLLIRVGKCDQGQAGRFTGYGGHHSDQLLGHYGREVLHAPPNNRLFGCFGRDASWPFISMMGSKMIKKF